MSEGEPKTEKLDPLWTIKVIGGEADRVLKSESPDSQKADHIARLAIQTLELIQARGLTLQEDSHAPEVVLYQSLLVTHFDLTAEPELKDRRQAAMSIVAKRDSQSK